MTLRRDSDRPHDRLRIEPKRPRAKTAGSKVPAMRKKSPSITERQPVFAFHRRAIWAGNHRDHLTEHRPGAQQRFPFERSDSKPSRSLRRDRDRARQSASMTNRPQYQWMGAAEEPDVASRRITPGFMIAGEVQHTCCGIESRQAIKPASPVNRQSGSYPD